MENRTPTPDVWIKEYKEVFSMDILLLKRTARIFLGLNHPIRQQLLKMMDERGKVTVTEMQTTLALEQTITSQHLAILRKAGMVTTKKKGKFIYYSVNYSRLYVINQCCIKLTGTLAFRKPEKATLT